MTMDYQLSQWRGYDAARIGDFTSAASLYRLAVEQFPKTRSARQTREFKKLSNSAASYERKVAELSAPPPPKE